MIRERLSDITEQAIKAVTGLKPEIPFDPSRRSLLRSSAAIAGLIFASGLAFPLSTCKSPAGTEAYETTHLLDLNGSAFSSFGWKVRYGPIDDRVELKPIATEEQTVFNGDYIVLDGKDTGISISEYSKPDGRFTPGIRLIVMIQPGVLGPGGPLGPAIVAHQVKQEVLLRSSGQQFAEIDSRVVIFQHRTTGGDKFVRIMRNESSSPTFQITPMEKVTKN